MLQIGTAQMERKMMNDIGKVKEALKQCPKLPFGLCYSECTNYDCPYYDEDGIKKLHKDTIALLQGQKKIIKCSDCKFYPNGEGSTKWLPCRVIITPPGWYCADGVRKDD